MNGSDLLAALAPVLAVLERLGVRHFVGGSVANSTHGAMVMGLLQELHAEGSTICMVTHDPPFGPLRAS